MFFLQKHLVFDNLEVAMSKILAKNAKPLSFLGMQRVLEYLFFGLAAQHGCGGYVQGDA
jgi:hypothetical protein